ncbi:hypothetical protein [uncultured Bacteroides sp.]|uniref:hypothetical protein n=1 Tax=uncultured Bacteroides sp. TaxID=162156 RepID=UPI0025E0C5AC|nr:hypothetical protein [uncultured Bacteroides sp.]
MKKVRKYIALLLGGIALMSIAACSDDDGRTASPIVDPNCIGASFGDDNTGFVELEDGDPTKMTLEVTRDKTDAAATVAIQVLANTGDVFSIPESVNFAAGEATTELIISFDKAEFKKEYSFEIALESSAVNPYKGNGFATFTIQRLKWVDVPGECTFKDWVFREYNKNNDGYKVKLEQVDGENRYRIVDPFKAGLEALGADPTNADEYLCFRIKPANKQVTFTTYVAGYPEGKDNVIWGLSAEDYMQVDDVDSKYDSDNKTVTFNVYYNGMDSNGGLHLIGQQESILELPSDFELVSEPEEEK